MEDLSTKQCKTGSKNLNSKQSKTGSERCKYLKAILKRTSASQNDWNVGLVKEVSTEDAFVDAFFGLVSLFGNGIKSLEDGNVIGLSVVKVDGQMGNSGLGSAVWDPGERWGLVSGGGNAYRT